MRKERPMAEKKKTAPLIAVEGIDGEHELLGIECGTVAFEFKGLRTMTGIWNVTALNKKAKDLIAKAKAEADG